MNTRTKVSTHFTDKRQTTDSKWDEAINIAQIEIEYLAKRKRRVEQALSIFKANKREGVPWPGSQPEGEK